jgi:hypothetical protein
LTIKERQTAKSEIIKVGSVQNIFTERKYQFGEVIIVREKDNAIE